jgi:tetratricopeptide (TPR) repeat protein
MSDGNHPAADRGRQATLVQRYEAMMARQAKAYFDVEDLELIIDHYLEASDSRRAKEALEFAKAQHPGSVDLMYSEAVVLINMGRLSRALEVLDALARIEPFSAEVHLHKAGIYSQMRNPRRAIEHYRRAYELAEEGRDEILVDMAFEHESLGAREHAIDLLKQALAINPENEAALYELAHCYELSDAQQASVAFFQGFTNEHPYSFVAWYNLGNALSQLERYEESNEALDLCLAIEEGFSSALYSKARNFLLLGRYPEAIACYEEVLRIDGPHAVTFSYIGECYEKMERYEQAMIHYDQAIALDPNWIDAWIGRGVVEDIQGRYPEAVRDLQVAVRLQPEHADAWFYLASALSRAARYEEARSAYAQVHTLDAGNLDAWLDHAELMANLKGPEHAIAVLRDAESVHRLDARFRYRLAGYLLRCGLLQQGLVELEEALVTDHGAHKQFAETFPEALLMPQVIHLLHLHQP